MTSTTTMDIKTIIWIEGRDGKVITWDLGKIGILSNTAKSQPEAGERWAVRVIRDTAPGERRGVLVLDPVKRLDDGEASIDISPSGDLGEVSENIDSLVNLAVACLCPSAEVKINRTADGRAVRYWVVPPNTSDATYLIGLNGKVVESLRTLVRHIASQAGIRTWLDVETSASSSGGAYAICHACGRTFSDMLEYEDNTSPGGAEDRFENDRPVKYAYRFCPCGVRVYTLPLPEVA